MDSNTPTRSLYRVFCFLAKNILSPFPRFLPLGRSVGRLRSCVWPSQAARTEIFLLTANYRRRLGACGVHLCTFVILRRWNLDAQSSCYEMSLLWGFGGPANRLNPSWENFAGPTIHLTQTVQPWCRHLQNSHKQGRLAQNFPGQGIFSFRRSQACCCVYQRGFLS